MGKSAGKKIGRRNFILGMARELRKMGHTVIELSIDMLYEMVPMYDHVNCFHQKKPINIKLVQYLHDPDFIYIEQMYERLNIDEVTCPVIYQHREYTHFPDILNPDMLLGSYHWRLRSFELMAPWKYSNIPYVDYCLVAVDADECKPIEEKTMAGIVHIGLAIPMFQFRSANGMFGDMVMEDQEKFIEEIIKFDNITNVPVGLLGKEFVDMLGRCEAVFYDAGRFGGLTRRLFEAMALKTLCVVRIHTNLQKQIYKEAGLTDEMCFFIETPEDISKVKFTEEERKTMADKAYEWVMENHTYEVRAREFIEQYNEFKEGVTKKPRFMGFALKKRIYLDKGQAEMEDMYDVK